MQDIDNKLNKIKKMFSNKFYVRNIVAELEFIKKGII